MSTSYKEKNIYVSLFTTVVVASIYCFKVYGMHEAGLYDGANGLKLVGKSVLILIGVMAFSNIILQILASIFFAVKGNDCKPEFSDERDSFIELKGMQVTYAVFGAGLIFSMIGLWQGLSVFWIMNALMFSMILGEIVGSCKKIFHYQRGF